MMVAVTRLRLRALYLLPLFFLHMSASVAQVRSAPGFIDGRLLADRQFAFWTLTRWQDDAALSVWRRCGAHGRAMPHPAAWCDEAAVVRWEQSPPAASPSWEECHRRISAHGRPSAVDQPSLEHRAGLIRPPATGRMRLEWVFARKPDRRR